MQEKNSKRKYIVSNQNISNAATQAYLVSKCIPRSNELQATDTVVD